MIRSQFSASVATSGWPQQARRLYLDSFTNNLGTVKLFGQKCMSMALLRLSSTALTNRVISRSVVHQGLQLTDVRICPLSMTWLGVSDGTTTRVHRNSKQAGHEDLAMSQPSGHRLGYTSYRNTQTVICGTHQRHAVQGLTRVILWHFWKERERGKERQSDRVNNISLVSTLALWHSGQCT